MKHKIKIVGSQIALGAILIASLLMTGCGKDETAGGTVGAASGAMLVAAVSGRHSKGEGALLGGLIGNYIGRGVGRSSDRKREKTEQKRRMIPQRELRRAAQPAKKRVRLVKKGLCNGVNFIHICAA